MEQPSEGAGTPAPEEKKVEEFKSLQTREEEEEAAKRANMKALDEFYPEDFTAKVLPDSKISRRNFAFHTVLGMPSMKRYNVHFLNPTTIIFVTGNKYQTYNLQTKKY